MRQIKKIYIHTSDSAFGDAELIDFWHRSRWKASPSGKFIGYHYVILNGRRETSKKYLLSDDGCVEAGRPDEEAGCHVSGENATSIGVCLIGKGGVYTPAQWTMLVDLVELLLLRYSLGPEDVFGHYQSVNARGKTCPDFKIEDLLEMLQRHGSGSGPEPEGGAGG